MAEKESKKKKKRWFSIVAGKEFNQAKLGETLAGAGEELVGRMIRVNLMSLMNDYKKQSFSAIFSIVEVVGEEAHVRLIGYRMNPAYMKRLVRKGVRKIEDSFIVVSKDNVRFIVKPVFLVRTRIKRNVMTKLRMIARSYFEQMVKELESGEVFMNAITNKFQVGVKEQFRKVYPIQTSELRILARLA